MERTAQQEDLKAHLMQTNEKFRHLMDEHHEYDRLVAELLALLNLKASDVYRHPEVSYKDASEAQHVKF